MNISFLTEALRHNWYLFLVLAVCAIGIIVLALRPDREDASPIVPGSPGASTDISNASPAVVQPRLTPAEEALRTIEAHQAEFDADPGAERAPSLLLSIGNLHAQKTGNYDLAIAGYEKLIAEYPDWEGIRKAFVQLASAYEHKDLWDKAKSVYEEMLRRFPPESIEYQYAQGRLAAHETAVPE